MTSGKAARNRDTGVTNKQEAFCHAIIKGAKIVDAYNQAYESNGMSKESTRRRAIALMNDPRITARLEALRAPAQAAVIAAGAITMEGHLAKLSELRDEGVRLGQIGPAITAEMARGKVAGFYIERREQGNPGEFQAMDAMRKQDAMQAIQQELDRRARLANGADTVDDVEDKNDT